MAKPTGRAVAANRGIGKGGTTSTKKPATLSGFAKKSGGQGSKATPVDVPKDRQPKNMGKAGEKKAGPKYGRTKTSKTY